MHAQLLSRQGYAGWIMRVREMRQEDRPAEQWLIDHSAEEPIVWLKPRTASPARKRFQPNPPNAAIQTAR